MMLTVFLAAVALLAGVEAAQAGFIVAPLLTAVGFTAGTTAFAIAKAVGTAALAVGASYAARKLLAPKQQRPEQQQTTRPKAIGGVELDIRMDADVPQSLIVGRGVTAGSLVYAETFGSRGEIDNSDLIEIISVADHPCEALHKVFIDGQEESLTDTGGDRGSTVDGFDDKLAVKFYDGSQTEADAFTVDKLGTHSERPWTGDMVGTGVTYARTHSIYDRDLVPGRMRWRFVVDGIKLYDPRKDSTVSGGSGSHRFDDLSTHEHTSNLAVIAYNILRGIRVADHNGDAQHFFGLEGTDADNLPLDNWFAAMNECDVTVDGEPQFHGGAEIRLDTEPIEALREILKACDGRLVEIGGIYKLYVGPPGLPAATFDDETLLASEEDTFRPVLPLEERINYVTGKYTAPGDGWIPKVAPPRQDSEAEESDGRRVEADLDAPWVQSGSHLQRLQKQMLAKARKERRHTVPLPPGIWGLEPGDVVEWTSERNGYSDKQFEVDAVEDHHDLSITATLIEIDETDYDWTAADDLIAEADVSLTTDRPAPVVIEGFTAQGIVHQSNVGTVRPAIRVNWDDPENDDIIGVDVQYRVAESPTEVMTAFSDEPTAEALVILAGLQSLTDYEVRAAFRTFTGRAVNRSGWIAVRTPDARMSRADLDAALDAKIKQLDLVSQAGLGQSLGTLQDALDRLSQDMLGTVGRLEEQEQLHLVQAGRQLQTVRAEIEGGLAQTVNSLEASVEENSSGITALATSFNAVFAETAEGDAEAMFRLVAQSAPSGVAARVALEAKTEGGSFGAQAAGLFLDVVAGVGTRASIVADRFRVLTDSGDAALFEVSGDAVRLASNVDLIANLLRSSDGNFVIDLGNKTITIET